MACDDTLPSNQTTQPLYVHQGADFDLAFTYQDSTGTAVNITGYTFEMVVVAKKPGGTAVATWNTAGGDFSITTAASGTFALHVAASETAALTPQVCFFDLIATSGTAKYPLAQGTLIIDEAA
jgi:hypothetical protein